MKTRNSLFWYSIVILISLCVIFFVGKKVNTQDGSTSLAIVDNGLEHFKKGMDVAGGVRLTYKIDLSNYRKIYTNPQEFTTVTKNIKDIILKNIGDRISKLGVSDYSSYIQSLDDGEYVVVEIGGVFDMDQAKEIIGKTVELEFKTAYEGDGTDVGPRRQVLAEELLKQAVADPSLMAELATGKQGDAIYHQTYTLQTVSALPQVYKDNLTGLTAIEPGTIYPVLLSGIYAKVPTMSGVDTAADDLAGWTIVKYLGSEVSTGADASGNIVDIPMYSFEDIFVDSVPSWVTATDPINNKILNGAFFKYATVGQSQTGQPVATINFNDEGKEIFCNLTEEIVGKPMAIFVGGELVTSPVIREKICGGSAQIDGSFTPASAKKLVDDLNEGALPAKLVLAHEEKISASLGDKALQGSLLAAGVGLIVVCVFMLFMYGPKKAAVALLTLLAFLIVLMAVIKLFGYALSLSGIAAILLSIGMGIDANVLIYERTNEEYKQNQDIKHAIINAYEKSWSAIRDGNLTTFMIALLLFFIGTNVFKGFGTMMMVNILLTLVIIVPLTKTLLLSFYGVRED